MLGSKNGTVAQFNKESLVDEVIHYPADSSSELRLNEYFSNLLLINDLLCWHDWTSRGFSAAVLPVLSAVCVCVFVCPGWGSVGAAGVLWPFELHFQALHADLEAVHGLDGCLSTSRVIEAHKACKVTKHEHKSGRISHKKEFWDYNMKSVTISAAGWLKTKKKKKGREQLIHWHFI